MSPQTYLSVITFVGLAVGFAGGVLSQLRKTSVDVDGKNERKLTAFGKLALAISVVGFVGSLASELLKSSIEAQQARDAQNAKMEEERWKTRSTELAAEILRNTKTALDESLKTRFEIADSREQVLHDSLVRETRLYGRLSATSAPLTSMKLRLIVEGLPSNVRTVITKEIAHAKASVNSEDFQDLLLHHNADADDARALIQSVLNQGAIQPFIRFLAGDEFSKKESLLVISLDKSYSAIVCVGWVQKPDAMELEDGKSVLPSGILIGDEIENVGSPFGSNESAAARKYRNRPHVDISVEHNSVVLSLTLDLLSINDSILRFAGESARSAALSDDIEFFAWAPASPLYADCPACNEYDVLPIAKKRVANTIREAVLRSHGEQFPSPKSPWLRNIKVEIIPNGVDLISKTYRLTPYAAGDTQEGPRGDDENGYVRLWHGHKE
jgi:hypothetical protein